MTPRLAEWALKTLKTKETMRCMKHHPQQRQRSHGPSPPFERRLDVTSDSTSASVAIERRTPVQRERASTRNSASAHRGSEEGTRVAPRRLPLTRRSDLTAEPGGWGRRLCRFSLSLRHPTAHAPALHRGVCREGVGVVVVGVHCGPGE